MRVSIALKASFLSLGFSLLSQFAFAQVPQYRLWGTSGSGTGNNDEPGYGSVFSVNNDGTDFVTLKKFAPNTGGSFPYGNLTKLPSGDLVGITERGGANDFGVIYKVAADGSNYAKIFEFNLNTGFLPQGNLLLASTGYLYGTTRRGENNGLGVIYRIKPDGSDFEKLHEFANGANPYGSLRGGLLEASDGKLYGIVTGGGPGLWGGIFRINTDGTGFEVVINFDHPADNLIEGLDGYLYALISNGGIFKVQKDGSDYQNIVVPNSTEGVGSFIQLSGGKLTGIFLDGANNKSYVFNVDADGSDFTLLHELSSWIGNNDLIVGSDNKIYGVYNSGVFRLDPDGNNFEMIYTVNGFSDGYVVSSLTESTPGVFIVTVNQGGASNGGIIFKLTDTGTYSLLKDFIQEGADPASELTLASNGDLYGTTTRGGDYGFGTLFKIKQDGSGYSKLHDFEGTEGRTPVGKLLEIPGGFLLGTTKNGGMGSGNIYKISLDGTGLVNIKADFMQQEPIGDLILGIDGFLYGVGTSRFNDDGILYKIRPNGTDFSVVVDFTSTSALTGVSPCGIRQISTGELIGVTAKGGNSFGGVVFKVNTNGSNLIKLKDLDFNYFNVVSKNIPFEASNGKLYGTNFFNGFIYSINTDGTSYQEYPATDYYGNSYGDIMELGDGNLYFINPGNIWRFNLQDSKFTKLFDSYKEEINPYSGLLALEKQNQTLTFDAIGVKNIGDPDFALNAVASSGLPIIYESSNHSIATISGNVVTIVGGGAVAITARQAGTITQASVSKTQNVVINKLIQTINFGSLPARDFAEATFELTASSSSGLPVSFSSSNTDVAKINGKTVTIVGGGSTTITASQGGNSVFSSASADQLLIVNKITQTITFNTLPDKTFGDAAFNLTGTSSSNLAITYLSSNENVAKIDGTKLTITGAGSATITAEQSGNSSYNVATSVEQVLTISKANQTITFEAIGSKAIGDSEFTLTGTSSSDLGVEYTTLSDKIAIENLKVKLVKPGRVIIKANQSGNSNYNPATEATQSFCVNPAKPTITSTNLNSTEVTLTSSASDGNQWYSNDEMIEGATSVTFKTTQAGIYSVKSTVDDCVGEKSDVFTLIVTGIEKQYDLISVYPNPVNDELKVDLSQISGEVKISIYDMIGRRKELTTGSGQVLSINTREYNSGNYVLHVVHNGGVLQKQFVKK